jgi:hypothetical protein
MSNQLVMRVAACACLKIGVSICESMPPSILIAKLGHKFAGDFPFFVKGEARVVNGHILTRSLRSKTKRWS